MSGGISATPPPPQSSSLYSRSTSIPSNNTQFYSRYCNTWNSPSSAAAVCHRALRSSFLQLRSTTYTTLQVNPRKSFRCNCSSSPGDNNSKRVLDAFFLGKAFAEALNERLESTVGEFLSTVGRLQAEQQKQVQEFQEEVLKKAKRAKEKAAIEAVEAQGLIPRTSTTNTSTTDSSAVVLSPTSTSSVSAEEDSNSTSTDALLGVSIDD